MQLRRLMIPILAAVILTGLATLVVLNLRAEKKIDVKPTHIYATPRIPSSPAPWACCSDRHWPKAIASKHS